MLTTVNPIDAVAFGRLMEFLSPDPPWNRSLWSIGLVLGMQELCEASIMLQTGTLSEASVKRICSSLQLKMGKDPALSAAEKLHLRQQIGHPPKVGGPAHHTVAQMANALNTDYLRRWAGIAGKGEHTVEMFARSVASHVLDAGFSAQHVRQLLKAKASGPDPITLAEICEELHGMQTSNPIRPFEVLLAFHRPPKLTHGLPSNWLEAEEVTQWLVEHRFDTSNVRAPAAIVLSVNARDSGAAAQVAREISDRFAARARIATGKPLDLYPDLWVAGDSAPTSLLGESRGVRVKELDREGRVFTTQGSDDSVEAALELLAHLDESSPPAAIAGGWGAIEGLLADPGDRATAADNLASLVACSFPRQELTSLSYKAQKEHPHIAAMLSGLETNRKRSEKLAELINEGKLPDLKATADRAAVQRVRKMLAEPSTELKTVRDTIAEAFHRLYRQRNLVLHGGRLDSVTLKASLRTVSKLAGAGMDRITHGHYVQSVRPLELVARANLSIALISKERALDCVDLLE
jgi:hypothetical protein